MKIGHIVRSITAAIFSVATCAIVLCQNQAQAADAGGAAGSSANVTSARNTYEAAMAKLVAVRQAAMKVAMNDAECRAAMELVQQTYTAYTASQKTNANVALSDPKYKELLKQKEALEAQLAKLQGDSGTSIEARAELAQKKLEFREQMRAIEEQINSASGSPDLKKQWQEACKAMEILQIKAIVKCEQVPVVAEAKKDAEAADQAYKQAMTQDATAQANYREELRQEIKADCDQRRQEVMNWNTNRYYNGGSYYRSW